jgi:tetratricopeptide (TPR) repeat protein
MQRKIFFGFMITCLLSSAAYAFSPRALPPWQHFISDAEAAQDRNGTLIAKDLLKCALGVAALMQDKAASLRELTELASLYKAEGHYDEAEDCCVQSVQVAKEGYGEPSAPLGLEYCLLSQLYAQQDRYELARTFNESGLENLEKSLPENSIECAVATHNQALLEQKCGNCSEAEKLYAEAYERFKKGPRSVLMMAGLSANSLAELFAKEHQYDKSEHWYRISIKILSKTLQNKNILDCITGNFIYVLNKNNKFGEAHKLQANSKSTLQ